MSRINAVTNPTGQAEELLGALRSKIGKDLNIFTTMANSPVALKSYMDFSGNLAEGTLSAGLREQLALRTAALNGCNYCASAHTAIGAGAGLNEAELSSALKGTSTDTQAQAALTFATALVKAHGQVSDADIAAVKAAGFDDGQIVEIVANVSLNIFTNYFNEVAKTTIDFPEVKACCGETGCAHAA